MAYNYGKGSKFIAYDNAMGNVSKTRQIVMLYDGIISFIQRAKDAMLNKNFQDNFNLLDRASTIITGLQASLDYENGGNVARVLESYYINMFARVMQLIHSRNESEYDNIVEEMKKMRNAWEHIDTENSAETQQKDPLTQKMMEQVVGQANAAGICVSV